MAVNILLVDDDISTISVILDGVDWKKIGIENVYVAHNIMTAKKKFSEFKVDIVVCDIEMPMGSGIDFLKYLREKGSVVPFVILTNYGRFELAQAAIEYKVHSYLLKPLNLDKLENELLSIIHDLSIEHNMQMFDDENNYLVSSFWSDLLHNHLGNDKTCIFNELNNRHLNISIDLPYRLLLITAGRVEEIEAVWGLGDIGIFERSLINLANEVIVDNLNNYNYSNYQLRNSSFFIFVLNKDLYSHEKEFINRCNRFIRLSQDLLLVSVNLYVSDYYSIEKLIFVKRKLEEMDRNNLLAKGKMFYEKDHINVNCCYEHVLDTEILKQLLYTHNEIKVLDFLKDGINALIDKNMISIEIINIYKQDFLQTIYVFLAENGILARELFSDPISNALETHADNTVADLIRWLIHVVKKTIRYAHDITQSSSVTYKVKQYINKNYQKNISREEISESVFLTPEYMARIFKAEEKISLNQYINQVRIERAKELLLEPDIRVSEVALQVGFDSFSYFSTVFKNYTGVSPREYQEGRIH